MIKWIPILKRETKKKGITKTETTWYINEDAKPLYREIRNSIDKWVKVD